MGRPARVQMREVANRAGVSISSVSRVLNDHPDVSPLMRERVLSAKELMGYEPDLLARSLRQGITGTVGFLVRDITNPVFAEIVKGAAEGLRPAGYSILLADSEGRDEVEAAHLQLFLRRRVDGLIVSLQSEVDPDTVAALHSADCPLVLVDREVAGLETSAVLCDHAPAVAAATRDIIECGHRRVAFIAGPTTIRVTRERLRGFRQAHEETGAVLDPELVRLGSYTAEFGRRETGRLLQLPDPPTAIVAAGTQVALGLLRQLAAMGRRVGSDVSVVSYDELDLMPMMDPPINVVECDYRGLGRLAASLLVEAVVHGQPPRTVVIPTHYRPRGSVLPLPR